MASSWHLLPREILTMVFKQFVDGRTPAEVASNKAVLLQLQHTCKSWANAARPQLYKHQFFLTLKAAKLLHRVLQQPGNTTRKLLERIKVTDELANDPLFIDIMQQCRNLTQLSAEAPKTYNSSMYFTSFFTILSGLINDCHLPRLSCVGYPLRLLQSNRILDHHQKAMLSLGSTLQFLHILESCVGTHSVPLQFFVDWINKLKQLPRLQHLIMELVSLSYLYEMDRFINQLGQNITLVGIILGNSRALHPLRPVVCQDITPHSPLRRLDIILDVIHLEDLVYIMYKFKRGVTTLGISESKCAPSFELETSQSKDSMTQFFKYLAGTPEYSMSILHVPNSCLRQMLRCMSIYLHIKRLGIQVIEGPTNRSASIKISNCTSNKRALDRKKKKQADLHLVFGKWGLISNLKFVYQLFEHDIEYLTFNERLKPAGVPGAPAKPCKVEKAVELAIDSLPSLKGLVANNAAFRSLERIFDPTAPKRSFDHLRLGGSVQPEFYYQLSQRIESIEHFLQPYVENVHHQSTRQHMLDMPYTAFGQIRIVCKGIKRYIVKLCTRHNITYQGIVCCNENLPIPTEEDYHRDRGQRGGYIGRITIYCKEIEMLKVGSAILRFKNENVVSIQYNGS
ncbi:hypothetical protein V8B55DRAFT_1479477 [Mucor lusitanicus]|uniref:F-box domain-containing protein n=2 Tax=Mucor circinelloides f. lusitanicus TaxID=29924 RepID=A0A168H725_MUCCL|nr:hypothetical protein FB192DRAFT_1377763 [Mucor lusitanicus]OAC98442.1 hypothetical protein MUCCIDRAFT_115353 [Mucor lusitanicus CBS 277.49]